MSRFRFVAPSLEEWGKYFNESPDLLEEMRRIGDDGKIREEWKEFIKVYKNNPSFSNLCVHTFHEENGKKLSPKEFVKMRLKQLESGQLTYPFYDRLGFGSTVINCIDCALEMFIASRALRFFVSLIWRNNNVYLPVKDPRAQRIMVSMEYVMSIIKHPSILSYSFCSDQERYKIPVLQAVMYFACVANQEALQLLNNKHIPIHCSAIVTSIYVLLKIEKYDHIQLFISSFDGLFLKMLLDQLDFEYSTDDLFMNRVTTPKIHSSRKAVALHIVFMIWNSRYKTKMIPPHIPFFDNQHNRNLIIQDRRKMLKYLKFIHYSNIMCSNERCCVGWKWHRYRYPPFNIVNASANMNDELYANFITSQSLEIKNKWYKCKGCRVVYYCSRKCQKCDWKRHKQICMKFRN